MQLILSQRLFVNEITVMSQVGVTGIPNLDPVFEEELLAQLNEVEELLKIRIQGDYPLVIETSRHLVEAGGKRLRPLLALITGHLGKMNGDVIKAATACELTHLGTLYHDDVMDEASLRRGVESANNRWGNSVAILTGDYLFAKTSNLLSEVGPEAVRLQAVTFERLVIGQILETQGPKNGEDPLTHYLRVVADKTGSLISASARFGAMLSGASKEAMEIVTEFGEKIGVAFQLADDVIDIASDSHQSGKTPGTDLKEGVPTLVTIRVMQSKDPKDAELKALLAKPIHDDKTVAEVILKLRAHPALLESRAQLHEVANNAKKLLSGLPISPARTALENLCSAIVDRSA